MRYLTIHEDKCIISDVASDMRIINGTVLGKPAHEVIHDIFAEQVDYLCGVNYTDATMSTIAGARDAAKITVGGYLCDDIDNIVDKPIVAVISHPYLCIIYGCANKQKLMIRMDINHTGYMEYAWYTTSDCTHIPPHSWKLCFRCDEYQYMSNDIYECVTCQCEPPIPALVKCELCGSMWVPMDCYDMYDICNECDGKHDGRLDENFQICGCCFGVFDINTVFIVSEPFDIYYCNDCLDVVELRCFICRSYTYNYYSTSSDLKYDNGELFVLSNTDETIENTNIIIYKDTPFMKTIRDYDKKLFDKIMSRNEHVLCHTTCVNIACNLNIFVKKYSNN